MLQLARLTEEYQRKTGNRITQQRIADLLELERATVSAYFRGVIRTPPVENLITLADFFTLQLGRRVSVDEILGRDGPAEDGPSMSDGDYARRVLELLRDVTSVALAAQHLGPKAQRELLERLEEVTALAASLPSRTD